MPITARSKCLIRRCFWITAYVAAAAFQVDAQYPTINAVLNGASYTTSIAPGSLATIFGTELASGQLSASSIPLPTQLAGSSVQVGTQLAPLYFVSPGQINFQVPFEATLGTVPITVTTQSGQSWAAHVVISQTAPSLFTVGATGVGRALVFTPSFQQAVASKSGDTIILYATGLGATVPPAQTGAGGAAAAPFNESAITPMVSIGGQNATVLFAGLAPDFVGVYQLNVVVPPGIESDTISLSSGDSNAAQSRVVQGGFQVVSSVPACAAGPTLLGDVNGDGVVTQEDANQILGWLAGSVVALGCPANADANQDGVITAADANAIMARVAGTSRALTVNLEGGLPGKIYVGGTIEIGAGESFFPLYVKSGTVRIKSASANYDSGNQNMVFQTDGRSLYWHWQTVGLPEAQDYQISVSLNQTGNLPPLTGANAGTLTATAALGLRATEPIQLSQLVDAATPGPGIPLTVTRSWTHDSYASPTMGPFGLGWKHSFQIQLREFTDGSVAFTAPGGVNRVFTGNAGGTYTSTPGDYGTLTRDPDGSFQLRETSGFLYHFGSNLLLDYVQDHNGNWVACAYDSLNRLVVLQHSSGPVFQLQYNALGFVSVLTDQNGRQTQYTYDAAGTHLASVTLPDGTVTSYTYVQGVGVAADDRLQVVAFPNGTHLSIAYDSTGRFASSQMDGGASKVVYSYPADGQTTITDAAGGSTSILVNEHLKPVQVTDALGNITKYQYDSTSNLIGITDPLGRTRSFSYDANGNLNKAIDPAGNQISMTYSPIFSQLEAFRDSRGYVTSFVLDSHANVQTRVYPDSSSESYIHDQFGLLTSRTDRKGQTILYTHTASGQLLSTTYPDKSSASYTYDVFGNLTSATDSSGTIALTYDPGNRLLSKTYPGGRALQFKYDNAGRRSQMTDADGVITNYTYDSDGRLSQLLTSGGQAIVSYQYDPVGRVSQKTLGNGAYTKYTYDLSSRVQRITNYSPSGSTISFFGYTYDGAGDVLSKTTVEGTEKYTYDSLGQLTGVSYPNGSTAQYTYDAAGNRISATEAGVQSSYVTNNLNEYQFVGGSGYGFDLNGNLISGPGSANAPYSYGYDFNNRLIRATTSSGAITYTYNALGERSSRTDQSGTVQYLWDGFEQAMEQTAGGQTIARYQWGRSLDEAVSMTRNGASYYYAQDALMSVSDLFDSTGRQDEHYAYNAFGAPAQTSGLGNPFFFTGARYDQGISLSSFRARWYSPSLGRFIQSDPAGLLGGVNLYGYTSNDPISETDPFGLCFLCSVFNSISNAVSNAFSSVDNALNTIIDYGVPIVVGAVVGASLDPWQGRLQAPLLGKCLMAVPQRCPLGDWPFWVLATQ